jgi:hypothetical protein
VGRIQRASERRLADLASSEQGHDPAALEQARDICKVSGASNHIEKTYLEDSEVRYE